VQLLVLYGTYRWRLVVESIRTEWLCSRGELAALTGAKGRLDPAVGKGEEGPGWESCSPGGDSVGAGGLASGRERSRPRDFLERLDSAYKENILFWEQLPYISSQKNIF
jgi:hypothetical protein